MTNIKIFTSPASKTACHDSRTSECSCLDAH